MLTSTISKYSPIHKYRCSNGKSRWLCCGSAGAPRESPDGCAVAVQVLQGKVQVAVLCSAGAPRESPDGCAVAVQVLQGKVQVAVLWQCRCSKGKSRRASKEKPSGLAWAVQVLQGKVQVAVLCSAGTPRESPGGCAV
ncbi:hypothetical protein EOD39_21901 [Acipenser ruthenus]|uniref:Uncharacterized protein n=1 Tax=Acipenser ruthenus TaxID=7906 RepID=A0A444URC9_ACIRT|nr:hypothetical protein EOD39_21901 [Acipenser ruthenus]